MSTETKKVFLTTIADLKDRSNIDYYICDEEAKYTTYTTAMSIAEAGIKYILSRYDVDEIIVLGRNYNANKDEKFETKLLDAHIDNIEDINSMSEYGFLCYRVSEFLNQLDFEFVDTSELIKDNEKEKIKTLIQNFKAKYSIAGEREIIYKLCMDRDLYRTFMQEVFNECTLDEQRWIKHYLYSEMDSYYKMHVKDNNTNTTIKFININDRNILTMKTISKVVKEILSEDNKGIDLYIDLQGLTPTDGNTLFSTFLMANRRIGYKCEVKGIINTKRTTGAFAGYISNAFDSYKIQKLVEGINLFLDYGKDNVLKECWNTLGIKSEAADKMFAAMDCIDEGIALCNIDLIVYGMRYIKREIDKYSNDVNFEDIYLDIVVKSIKADYGEMFAKGEIYMPGLLKWLLNKGFYQQILTLIESKIPSDMVERGIYYYAKNENDVEDFLQKLNVCYWSEIQRMRWQFSDVNHFFIKYYGRFAIDYRQKPELVAKDFARFKVEALKNNRDDVAKVYSDLNNDKLLFDLLFAYYRLGILRNMVNHAEELETDMNGAGILHRKDFIDEIKIALNKFINIYSRACDEVKCTKKPLTISEQMMKGYARNHELKILDESNPLVNHNSYTCQFNGKEVKIDITLFKNDEYMEE